MIFEFSFQIHVLTRHIYQNFVDNNGGVFVSHIFNSSKCYNFFFFWETKCYNFVHHFF